MRLFSCGTVQTAIQSLHERDFISQSDRGAYALEDGSFSEWFKHRPSPSETGILTFRQGLLTEKNPVDYLADSS